MSSATHKSILITGGAGFIGANTAAHFLSIGYRVTIYDNFSRPGVKTNVDWLKSLPQAKSLSIIVADTRDSQKIIDAVKNQPIIFHLAGQTAVTTSINHPHEDFDINVTGTINLLEAIRLHNPHTILIYASTNKVYGDLSQHEVIEQKTRYQFKTASAIAESEKLNFFTPYGCSKGAADQYITDYGRIYNFSTIVFRQSCIYGEHQFGMEDQGWVAHLINQAIQQKPITIFGNGKQVRDVLHVEDLIRAYQTAIETAHNDQRTYNVGGGPQNTLSLLELITQLNQLMQRHIPYTLKAERQGDQKVYISNISKAKTELHWEPAINVNAGMQRVFHWLKHHQVV
jgi:CDP-paratose 2-epimerase